MTATDDHNAVLLAVTQSEQRTAAAIEECTAKLQASITTLTELHHAAILAQERRNAEFARSDRVESVASRVHDQGNQITTNNLKIATLEKGLADIGKKLDSIEKAAASRTLDLLGGVAGWVGLAVLMFGCAFLTWFLTGQAHVVHPK